MMKAFRGQVATVVILSVSVLLIGTMLIRSGSQMQTSVQAAVASASATSQATEPRTPIRIAVEASLISLTTEELAGLADLVILGTVETISTSRWNTPDGTLPAGTTVHNIADDLLIFTDVAIRVEQYLKGSYSDEPVWVRVVGGTAGQDSMIVSGEPDFEVGQRVLLFLTREDVMTGDIGPEHFIVRGLYQGAYEIVDERAVSRSHEMPLAELLSIIGANR